MKKIDNQSGFTLLEVLIALLVLTIGMLGIANLQILAIQQNGTAYDRTRANAVALAVLEELKRLPFDHPSLDDSGGNLDDGKATGGGNPAPGSAEHSLVSTGLPGLGSSYSVNGTNIVDGAGGWYTVFWNVENFDVTIGTETFTPYCTIRLFVYWNRSLTKWDLATATGLSQMEVTTVKYNNIEI